MHKRKDFPFPTVIVMFGSFILLCGTTHVMSIVTLWDPVYRFDGLLKAATALASIITVIALIPLVPLALALKSPKELEEANLKLAHANEQLKEIDRLKDDFFSNISHELRTPLTLILSPLESFLANDYGVLNETQRKNLEAMHNNSIRLFQMVNSILDFAKIGNKKIEVIREPLDIVALTQAIIGEFEPIGKQKQLNINFSCELKEKCVAMDRYLFERIVFNILSNAIKFTPNDGTISSSLFFKDEKIILRVCDTGIGISQENQKKLFQRFQQIESSATRRFEGTGLGLSLVKEFALLLEGDVKVESELNKGTTFIIEISAPSDNRQPIIKDEFPVLQDHFQKFQIIPLKENSATKAKNKAETPTKILVAEDNMELANYIISLVNDFAETKHVNDGEQALDLIKSWEPDLILLDVMMPKRDGISVCYEIKPQNRKYARHFIDCIDSQGCADTRLGSWSR